MNRREISTVALGTLLSVCGSGPFYVAPAFLGELQRSLGLSLGQLGMISGAENLGIALACMLTSWRLGQVDRRVIFMAAMVCVGGNALIAFATDFYQVLAIRALTGFFGEGPLYAMGYLILGSARSPDRAFGIGIGVVVICAAIVFEAAGSPLLPFGPAAVLVPYAGFAVILAMISALTRYTLPVVAPTGEESASGVRFRVLAALMSIILWSAAAAAFWAFTDTASATLHVDQAAIAHALSVALLVGLVGMVVPVLLGDRLGRAIPLGLATAGLIVSCFLFLGGGDWVQLAIALSIQQFSWNVAVVYQLAGVASIDAGGRYSAYGAVAQIGGMAAGPVIAGAALGLHGYATLPFVVMALGLAAFTLFVLPAPSGSRNTRLKADEA